MTDYSAIKTNLLAKQQELSDRLKATQATEGHEVEEGLDSKAQLWEVSEVRDGLDDECTSSEYSGQSGSISKRWFVVSI